MDTKTKLSDALLEFSVLNYWCNVKILNAVQQLLKR